MDLDALIYVDISDNIITTVERSTFANLNMLTDIRLRGNKINKIEAEGFQNLPSLCYLDLAYNSLKNFNFASLDQVLNCFILKCIPPIHYNVIFKYS